MNMNDNARRAIVTVAWLAFVAFIFWLDAR